MTTENLNSKGGQEILSETEPSVHSLLQNQELLNLRPLSAY